jgi:hypothetical protein
MFAFQMQPARLQRGPYPALLPCVQGVPFRRYDPLPPAVYHQVRGGALQVESS